jgi:DNA-binding CsgD family transcriptional regulator/pimeloyl-ACP methyl ester carboxylesterase
MRAMNPPRAQFVTTSDGFSIAYAVSGEGPALVFMPGAFSHVQLAWREGISHRPWMEGLARRFRLIQFDGRGKGMSSRGLPADFTAADSYQDLVAVLDRLRLPQVVLMATTITQTHVAFTYVKQNHGRVRALVLSAPVSKGSVMPRSWMQSMAAQDWETFLHSMAVLGGGPDIPEDIARLKQSTTQSDWLAYVRVSQSLDLEADLPLISIPTLILHPRDWMIGVEESMKVAAAMPNARVVLIDGAHIFGDAEQGIDAIEDFLDGLPMAEDRPAVNAVLPGGLSEREVEVLRLIARGRSNPQIALELVISVNTVQNHVSSILAKTGLSNRAEASSYAQHRGLGPE